MASFVGLTPESFQKLDDFMSGGGGGGSYTLPTMSANTKGGAMVGDGLAMTGDALGIGDGGVDMDMLSQEVQEAIAEGDSGYNPSLSVGRADALTGADSTAQWSQRVTEGSGSAIVRSVQGAAVGWNQLVPDGNFTDATKWRPQASLACSTSIADNTLRVTVTDNTAAGRPNAQPVTALEAPVVGHKYLLRAEILNNTGATCSASLLYGANSGALITVPFDGEWHKCALIVTCNSETVTSGLLYINENVSTMQNGAYAEWRNYTIIDLTAMFGSGNEPATVEEFEQMYPAAYYPYSAPTLKPVQIAGIRSTDAQGGELDAIEWTAQTLRAAGSVRDMLYSDHVETRVGVVDMGTLDWSVDEFPANSGLYRFRSSQINGATSGIVANLRCAPYNADPEPLGGNSHNNAIVLYNTRCYIRDDGYTDAATYKAAMSGVYLFFELATTTTTPISPALPMTYRVEQGGTEAIIVPEGEISAVPIITVADGESASELVMDALACIATPDGPIATANHSVGTYLTMQGKLYKVTSAIAVGESIVAGTNVTQTTVMAELLALTA